jgi:probable HAF family extracellular repeat protein
LADTTFTDLGVLPGGTYSLGVAVSRDGTTIAGNSGPPDDTYEVGFVWHNAGPMQGIGVLPGGPTASVTAGISGNGSVVVGWSGTQDYRHAFRWTSAGGMQAIPGLSTDYDSQAVGVSSNGLTIVGVQFQNNRSFIWTAAGGLHDLGVTPLSGLNYASAISGDGTTVIGVMGSNATGWRWNSTTGTTILGGGAYSYANGVSDDGSVVVGEYLNPTNRAFRWTQAGGLQSLGTVPGYTTFGAKCVSGDGNVVGVRLGNFPSNDVAGLWTAERGMFDLQLFLTQQGIDMSGWTLNRVAGISYDGQVITGYGRGPNGVDTHAWIVRGLNVAPFVCRADFNGDGLGVDDIFDFLNAWFAGDPRTDFNGVDGVTVQDIFDFLNAWFAGC